VKIPLPSIFFVGPMAAGKSTIGRHLAQALNRDFYDIDREIEERAGASVGWIFDIEGPDGFAKREEKTLLDLVTRPGIVLATGGGTVLSTVNRGLLATHGYVIHLAVTLDQQVSRTLHDKRRPQLHHSNPRTVLEDTNAQCLPLYESLADWSLQTDARPAHHVVQQILTYLDDYFELPVNS